MALEDPRDQWAGGAFMDDDERREALFAAIAPWLETLIRPIVRSEGLCGGMDADDATLEILLLLWRWQPNRTNLNGPAFRAGLRTIARNHLRKRAMTRNHAAARMKRIRAVLAGASDAVLAGGGVRGPTRPGPSRAETTARSTIVSDALAAVSATDALVIRLRDVDGCAYSTIAEITGRPIGSVGHWLRRARARLLIELRRRGLHAAE